MALACVPRLGILLAALLMAIFSGVLLAAPADAQSTSRVTCES